MITSPDNQHLKELRKLARRSGRARSGRFLAEGEDLHAAAAAAGWEARVRLCPAGLAPGDGWLEVAPALLAGVSTLGSGTRAIAVYDQRWAPAPVGPVCVYLHGVGDPGNVGTIIRAAHAFGAGSVALGPDCADPYGPKAVRASMGAIFSVPLARATPGELPGELVGLDGAAPAAIGGPFGAELTLLVGAERDGLGPEVLGACDRVVSIPQDGGHSLNAAMAATIGLYEVARDRRARAEAEPAGGARRMAGGCP
ncbi:MAG: methyltransferase, TrmH family [Solirubrobacteraceae bacterium]|jgi:TrmH family RNA methyltransferase|nr:methyltransferase, TrmH family [Solirubrobacteraceae bacterium]